MDRNSFKQRSGDARLFQERAGEQSYMHPPYPGQPYVPQDRAVVVPHGPVELATPAGEKPELARHLRSDPDCPSDASFKTGASVRSKARARSAPHDVTLEFSDLTRMFEDLSDGTNDQEHASNDIPNTASDTEQPALNEDIGVGAADDPAPEEASWGPVLSFKLPPVEPFPTDIYPAALFRLIHDEAKAIGCPSDFLALPALAVAGAAIGRSAILMIMDGYPVSASIYALCVGQPSDGKSPAVRKVTDALTRVQEAHTKKFREDMASFRALQEQCNTHRKLAARSQSHHTKRKLDDDVNDQLESDDPASNSSEPDLALSEMRPVPPMLRRILVRDTTTEAMDVIMAQNPRGLVQVFDEASSLVASMNQYRSGKGADRQWYMSTWSGQARVVDRKGNPEGMPICVPDPFLCIVGGMVPDMIGSFCDGQGRHDGFLDRILFAYPDPLPKAGWMEIQIPEEIAADWSGMIDRLHGVPMQIKEAEAVPNVVRFDREAKQAWAELINAHHAEQRSVDFAPSLRGPWGKLEQYAGRIVLILHMLDLASDTAWSGATIPDVQPKTVLDAGRLLNYLKSHTRRIYAAMHARARREEGSEDVQAIIKWVVRRAEPTFSLRDLNRDLTKTFGSRSRAQLEALAWLINTNHIRLHAEFERKPGQRGRRRSAQYDVHPHLLASRSCHNRRKGVRVPVSEITIGNSYDSATDPEAKLDSEQVDE